MKLSQLHVSNHFLTGWPQMPQVISNRLHALKIAHALHQSALLFRHDMRVLYIARRILNFKSRATTTPLTLQHQDFSLSFSYLKALRKRKEAIKGTKRDHCGKCASLMGMVMPKTCRPKSLSHSLKIQRNPSLCSPVSSDIPQNQHCGLRHRYF